MKDASQNALIAAKLMNRDEEQKLKRELGTKYENLREQYNQEQEQLQSIEEARKNKLNLWKSE
jgi:5-methyltetrahydrofolate--homocysteine methyltransferase